MNVGKVIKRFEQELFVVDRMTPEQADIENCDPAFVDGYWYGRKVSIQDTLRTLRDMES